MINYEHLENNYANNMLYVANKFPQIYKKILTTTIDNYELFEEINGEINILVNGNKLYPENIEESITKQIEVFKHNQPTIFKAKPEAYSFDNEENLIHDATIIDIQTQSKLINNKKQTMTFKGYKNLDNNIPVLILFGMGSGRVVEKLLEEFKINRLYIIEHDLSMLKISFHLYDWSKIFNHFFKENRTIMFQEIHNTDDYAFTNSSHIINDIIMHNPMYGFNLNYLIHYNHNSFKEVQEYLSKNAKTILDGWGFIDDNINSINHSILTYKKKKKILKKYLDVKTSKQLNILIIANGPSLDNDIEEIKRLQSTHIVFSCGTTIKTLYNNGIKPDFHFEIERDINVYDALTKTLTKEYLKTITLIGLNVLHPKTIDLFENAFIYLRTNDAGASLLSNEYPRLKFTNPSVANGTLSFATYLNPKDIYLFGLDLGTTDKRFHHSQSSSYYDSNNCTVIPERNKIKFTHTIKGNFEEKVHSEKFYLWTKQALENCIYDIKDINIYNCSNGAFIMHTVPLHSEKIKVIQKNIRKQDLINNIKSLFIPLNELYFHDIIINIDSNINKSLILIHNINKYIKDYRGIDNLIYTLDNILQEITKLDRNKYQITNSIFSGTIKVSIAMIYTHVLAMNKNTQNYDAFIVNAFNTIKQFLTIAIEEIKKLKRLSFKT